MLIANARKQIARSMSTLPSTVICLEMRSRDFQQVVRATSKGSLHCPAQVQAWVCLDFVGQGPTSMF